MPSTLDNSLEDDLDTSLSIELLLKDGRYNDISAYFLGLLVLVLFLFYYLYMYDVGFDLLTNAAPSSLPIE